MREITKLGLILLAISAIAAALLGYTNAITEGPIANQILQANILARQTVLAEATDFEEVSQDTFSDYSNVLEVHRGIKDGQTVGYTIKTNPAGYGGPIEVMVGVSVDAVVSGVSVGNHAETPGLGAKAADDDYRAQYAGKNAMDQIEVIKAGTPKDNEVSAIAGATISSRAVTDGVNMATKLFNEKLK